MWYFVQNIFCKIEKRTVAVMIPLHYCNVFEWLCLFKMWRKSEAALGWKYKIPQRFDHSGFPYFFVSLGTKKKLIWNCLPWYNGFVEWVLMLIVSLYWLLFCNSSTVMLWCGLTAEGCLTLFLKGSKIVICLQSKWLIRRISKVLETS